MRFGKTRRILRNGLCLLLAVTAAGWGVAFAEDGGNEMNIPADACFGTERTTGLTYEGRVVDFTERDVFTALELPPKDEWNVANQMTRKARYENAAGDSINVSQGRVFYIRGNASKDIDRLFSQLMSDLSCVNNNQLYRKELFDLSQNREQGMPAASVRDEKTRRNCAHAAHLLKRLVPDQDTCLLNVFEKSGDGKDYTCLVFGFRLDGLPVYGYNETLLNIINPDETDSAVRELALVIYDREGLAGIEIEDIMTTEATGEVPLMPFDKAAEKLNIRLSEHPEISYTVRQSWLSEVPLGDFSRQPLEFTPCWNFFLTWEEDGETWCATPRINAVTGEVLWW